MSRENKLSRRDFIKEAAAGAAAVAGAGALSTLGTTPAQAQAQCPSTGLPAKWDEETDVLVIGAGMGGLAAAVEAATQGAKVTLLEGSKLLGGLALVHNASWDAYGTSIAKKQGITVDPKVDNRENFYKFITYGREDVMDLDLVNYVIDHNNEAFEWIIGLGHNYGGIDEVGRYPWLESHRWGHHAAPISSTGSYDLAQLLKKQCDKLGVKIVLQTRASQLYPNPATGEILGAKAETGGQTKYYKAKRGVVLATGGFALDKDMLKAYSEGGMGAQNWTTASLTWQVGDGHKMGIAVGAALTCMEFGDWNLASVKPSVGVGSLKMPDAPKAQGKSPSWNGSEGALPGSILVNDKGYRFVDETAEGHYVAYQAARKASGYDGLNVWLVFDSAAIAKVGGTGVCSNFEFDIEKEVSAGYVSKANSILDLAKAIKMSPPENLAQTVDRWNAGAAMKPATDVEYAVPSKFIAPIAKAPFYATRLVRYMNYTFGGLKRNLKSEILNTQSKPIPRLYGVGRVCGGFLARFSTGGTTFMELFVMGRIAGANAAAQKPWDAAS